MGQPHPVRPRGPSSGSEQGPARDMTLLNASATLQVAGRAGDWAEGLERAAAAVDDGRAARTLEKLVTASQA